jgi:MFS family permease
MAVFTQVGAETSYVLLLGALFVMGLGMGATMMPIMTSALQTLRDHEIARGSTLMNITQQVSASIGTALFSVILTSSIAGKELAGAAIASQQDPAVAEQVPAPALAEGFAQAADSFGLAFLVGTALIALCLVPAALLPKKQVAAAADEDLPPVLLH